MISAPVCVPLPHPFRLIVLGAYGLLLTPHSLLDGRRSLRRLAGLPAFITPRGHFLAAGTWTSPVVSAPEGDTTET